MNIITVLIYKYYIKWLHFHRGILYLSLVVFDTHMSDFKHVEFIITLALRTQLWLQPRFSPRQRPFPRGSEQSLRWMDKEDAR